MPHPRAVEHDPELSTARLVLADALLALERSHDALAALGSTIDRDVQLKRAEILFTVGESDGAAETLDRVLEGSSDESLLIEVVDLLLWGERHDDAVRILQRPLAGP
jgi:tetratricopeptide (TPR) repeat protein